jgi:hypothetical protein
MVDEPTGGLSLVREGRMQVLKGAKIYLGEHHD